MDTKGLRSLARRYALKAVVMFGSRARGNESPGSDCDICVSAPAFQGDELGLIADLSEALREDVDVCIFERVGPSLKFTIAMEGRLLCGSSDTFDRLRLRAVREWQDSRKMTDALRAYLDRFTA